MILNRYFKKLTIASLGLILWDAGLALAKSDIFIVTGWPLPVLVGDAPDISLGDEPVLGRQACPALTRLNLISKRSEDLLLRRAVEEYRDPARGALWRFELRHSLFWWNGDQVSAHDIAAFIQTRLADVVRERGEGLWPLPEYTVAVERDSFVTVAWRKTPIFGPYVFNGVPLSRPIAGRGDFKFECAGLYRIEPRAFGLALVPNAAYKLHKPLPEVHLYRPGAESSDPVPPPLSLGFRYASEFGGTPWTRIADDVAPCRYRLDVPYGTMITWNTKSGATADPHLRSALTQLIPRGSLLRSAAASLGELLSAPIPKIHPGYNPKINVRPFELDAAAAALDRLGYRRHSPEAQRLTPSGEAFKLVLEAPAVSTGLVEKVVVDAFNAVGIGITYVPRGQHTSSNVDGRLVTVELDWPRADFLGNLHSALGDTAPFWSLADRDLDALLEEFALSLTKTQPSFETLAHIHQRVFDHEPASVILQHKACVDPGRAVKLTHTTLNLRDSDWFRQILF